MDNSVLKQFLQSRASHRKFIPEEVNIEDIRLIIDSSRFAPSGHNHQPWKFIVIRRKAVIAELSEIVKKRVDEVIKMLPENFTNEMMKYRFFIEHFESAPCVILVAIKKEEYITSKIKKSYKTILDDAQHFDMELIGAGAVIQNLLLSALTLGYATCWMTEPVVYAQKEIEVFINLESDYHFVSLIALGKPVKQRECLPKKEVNELLSIIC